MSDITDTAPAAVERFSIDRANRSMVYRELGDYVRHSDYASQLEAANKRHAAALEAVATAQMDAENWAVKAAQADHAAELANSAVETALADAVKWLRAQDCNDGQCQTTDYLADQMEAALIPASPAEPAQEQLTDDPRVKALVDAVQDAIDANPTELNLGNYEHGDVCSLQNEAIDVWQILTDALAQFKEPKP
jgi:hypothetical protein